MNPNAPPDEKTRATEFALHHTIRRHGTTMGIAAENDYKRFYLDYLEWIRSHTKEKPVVKTVYEIRYVGAPYGEDESGHVVSRHRTLEAAERSAARLQRSPKYYRNVKIVEIRKGR